MVTIDPKAYIEIDEFIKNFKKKYSKNIKISFVIDDIKELNIKNQKIFTLEKVEQIVNKLLNEIYGKPIYITTRSRNHFLICYRYIMFKFLFDIGYTVTAIGKHFCYSHPTVVHGKGCIKRFISIDDKKTLTAINIFNEEIQRHITNN